MKRILWFTRSQEWSADRAAGIIRRSGHDLPEVEAKPVWMRDTPFSIEMSSEKFPGSLPVWVWEE